MSNFRFSSNSLRMLNELHTDLISVVKRALELSDLDFSVTYGMRTTEEQAEILKEGNSTTSNSRHLTGHAVDLTPWLHGSVDGDDPKNWDYFEKISIVMKLASFELKIPVEWGGDWENMKNELGQKIMDGYHFQLPWKDYPLK